VWLEFFLFDDTNNSQGLKFCGGPDKSMIHMTNFWIKIMAGYQHRRLA